MERDLLERYLKQGLSLPQIGALVDRDPSSVGYWVQSSGWSPMVERSTRPEGD